ncbi:unnamed protein product [Caenorhabditis auriculariae]|uniref:Insulin-degrading enzyme n=1 Tax=Caenorhabditis auriculariae TaxID=2777116 RepID=A0A8S1HDP0_9PELO|nr:unnamed protein product [Caenorhabditis auriculariae]
MRISFALLTFLSLIVIVLCSGEERVLRTTRATIKDDEGNHFENKSGSEKGILQKFLSFKNKVAHFFARLAKLIKGALTGDEKAVDSVKNMLRPNIPNWRQHLKKYVTNFGRDLKTSSTYRFILAVAVNVGLLLAFYIFLFFKLVISSMSQKKQENNGYNNENYHSFHEASPIIPRAQDFQRPINRTSCLSLDGSFTSPPMNNIDEPQQPVHFKQLKLPDLNVVSPTFANIAKSQRQFSTCRSSKLFSRSSFGYRFVLLGRKFSSVQQSSTMSSGKNIVVRRVDNIVKSAQDNREYRGLELKNGLKVLLVSDPETDKSAAALDVNVGHLMDPWELPGLAHFCEHMLFLGTEKYPSENEYSKFISANAGSTNAYTASDHTNYHFDVKPDQLPGALDRFVQFFLSPQFTESATEREVCAVDSEHSNNLNNDGWRMLQVDRSLSKKGHDYGKFGTGNKKTLLEDARAKGIEPREALLRFHKKWYSSNIMTLCVVGKESLDDLQSYLGDLEFESIENKNVERVAWNESPYGPEQLGKRIEVVPVKDTRTLQVVFPIPDYNADYKSQPSHYISHLLGHEGPGSLLSELKRRGWVSSLYAGGHTHARGFGVFEVTVDLSQEGLEHTEDIVALVFNYIGMVRKEGVKQWIFEELRDISDITFRFKDKVTPMSTAKNVSSKLQYTPFEDVLSVGNLVTEFNQDKINEILSLMTPENMIYRVVSKTFEGREGNTFEPVYGTEIRVAEISQENIQRFDDALKSRHPNMHLPEKNEYIPTKFDLKPRVDIKSEHPQLIHEDGWSRIWFKQDDEYKMPKAETKIALTTPIVAYDPRRSLLSSLWLWCLNDTLTEETYNADLAGLRSHVESGPFGVQIRVCGYDEKQSLFMKHLIQRAITFKIDPTRFNVLFDSLRRALQNFAHSQPYSLSQHYAQMLLGDKIWSKEQLLAVCNDITLEEVESFPQDMFKAFHMELLVHGNATKEEALTLGSEISQILRGATPVTRPLFWNEFTPRREYALENGDQYIYRHFQSTHDVSCVEVLYQVGVQNTRDIAIVSLLEQILREPAFNQLRTNEQLGYIVWVGTRLSAGTLSLSVIVQGPKGPDHVLERIEAFLNKAKTDLLEMPQEEFDQQVNGMITRLLEKPKTLSSRFKRFWNEIECRQYHFSRREDEVEYLKNVKKEELLALFDRKFLKTSPELKKLAVFVHGKNENKEQVSEILRVKAAAGDAREKEISNLEELRQTLSLYGRPKAKLDLLPIGLDPLEQPQERSVLKDEKPKSKY